ncbi:MAG: APC family permease, partial [Traorella sp.]
GRASWYYWINFPLWMAYLAVMVPDLVMLIFGIELNLFWVVFIELLFVWVVVFISFFPVCDSIWILNGAAAIKVFLAVAIGCLGIYGMVTNGLANPITFGSLLPSFDLDSLSYISVIIFNMLGFEVICTFADDMEDPKKQIPQAIVIGGVVIALIYVFSAFGIGAAIPTAEISTDSGLLDAFMLLLGTDTGLIIILIAFLFLLTLFGNMISWSLGVNNTAAYAAENGDMPAIFAKRSEKNDMPIGSAIMNGVVATIVVILGIFLGESDLFWSFFALNLVMFLASYIMVFPSFLKLRKEDTETPRLFKVPGNDFMLKVMAYVPMVLIIVSIIFTAVPLSFDPETLAATLPITIGAIIFFIIGEIIIVVKKIPAGK